MRQTFGPYEAPPAPEDYDDWDDWDNAGAISDSHRVPIGAPLREDIVESESSPGTYYTLKMREYGVWTCSCPGYVYRGECKHSRRKAEEKPW